MPEFSTEEVVRAIRSFARASVPDPSGLRTDHIKETLSTAHGDAVAAQLVLGGAPSHRPLLGRRGLACLAKKQKNRYRAPHAPAIGWEGPMPGCARGLLSTFLACPSGGWCPDGWRSRCACHPPMDCSQQRSPRQSSIEG